MLSAGADIARRPFHLREKQTIRESTMTAYELAALYVQTSDNVAAQFTNWITILSLYLGAGYLVAHRLTFASALVFTGIFVIVAVGSANVMVRAIVSLMGVGHEIRVLAEQGKGLTWHQAAVVPAYFETAFPVGSAVLLGVVLIGAVYFFFSSRRENLKSATSKH
jgi:hypothetical protein